MILNLLLGAPSYKNRKSFPYHITLMLTGRKLPYRRLWQPKLLDISDYHFPIAHEYCRNLSLECDSIKPLINRDPDAYR